MPPHLVFLTIPSPGLLLQKSPLSKHKVAQQQSTAWRDAGRLHCSATREREKHREKKKIKLLLEGERLLLFLRSSVGCAALRAPARPWRLHRAAVQDGVEVSVGCGAAGLFLIEVFINHIQDNR